MENTVNNIISLPNGLRQISNVGWFFEFLGSCQFLFFEIFQNQITTGASSLKKIQIKESSIPVVAETLRI
jgi:hypothetical protein